MTRQPGGVDPAKEVRTEDQRAERFGDERAKRAAGRPHALIHRHVRNRRVREKDDAVGDRTKPEVSVRIAEERKEHHQALGEPDRPHPVEVLASVHLDVLGSAQEREIAILAEVHDGRKRRAAQKRQ